MAKHHDFFFVKNTLSGRDISFLLLFHEKVLDSDIPEPLHTPTQPQKIAVNPRPTLHIINTGLSHRVERASGGSAAEVHSEELWNASLSNPGERNTPVRGKQGCLDSLGRHRRPSAISATPSFLSLLWVRSISAWTKPVPPHAHEVHSCLCTFAWAAPASRLPVLLCLFRHVLNLLP